MFQIKAKLDHLSEGVGTFDPLYVISKMRAVFPEMEESSRDHLQNTCRAFAEMDKPGSEGALKTAVKDLYERGPAIQFVIPLNSGRTVSGVAERYWVLVNSDEPFPKEFEDKFTTFLESLWLQQPEITKGEMK